MGFVRARARARRVRIAVQKKIWAGYPASRLVRVRAACVLRCRKNSGLRVRAKATSFQRHHVAGGGRYQWLTRILREL
jgi:hypothetical protein